MYGTPCVASADLARHDAEMDRMYAEERYIEDLVAEEQDALALRIMRTPGWCPQAVAEDEHLAADVRDALHVALDGDEAEAGRRLVAAMRRAARDEADRRLEEAGRDYLDNMPARVTYENTPDPVTAGSVSLREFEA